MRWLNNWPVKRMFPQATPNRPQVIRAFSGRTDAALAGLPYESRIRGHDPSHSERFCSATLRQAGAVRRAARPDCTAVAPVEEQEGKK
jgi:hypothetical protein